MKAVVYDNFREMPDLRNVDDPVRGDDGVVIEVKACGICRSDWHGWMGNDPDIVLPHVPGHELAGVIAEIGPAVSNWQKGDRVTVPFVGGCGKCSQCRSGNQQVCDQQFQPGFTAWGAFAEYVAIDYADENLVRLPDSLDFVTASSLGCRFITSFRAVVDQGRVKEGDWIAVFGCGGVGLSAIMIAKAFGAKVIAIDLEDEKLELARTIGADEHVNAGDGNAVEAIKDHSAGGADISLDAIGAPRVVFDSVSCLRKRGRHVQIGLMEAGEHDVLVPMNRVIAGELEILGSHGMQAHRYPEMLEMIEDGRMRPEMLVGRTVTLEESIVELTGMDAFAGAGVKVIDRF
ncbi:MAG: zinc-dependent alcohol dehydrogenase family protein [Acidobacteriota bacterium]|nr:zinc-dependent alcohol dehydrogenase family protein [Acidobacteriota bacterium]